MGTWNTDKLHSSVRFEVEHMGASIFGAGFRDFEASVVSGPDGAELRGTARVESFEVQDEQLRPHVMSPEFLDVERHPELTFRSTALRPDGDELVAEGQLTIRGTTRDVEARGRVGKPVEDPYGSQRLALTLGTVVDRTEFGLGWQMDLPGGGVALANEVKLVVSGADQGVVRPCTSSASPAAFAADRTTPSCSGRRQHCCRPVSSSNGSMV
ncbi:MAG: YceI family protein [Thermoleophilaceae bacterium]